MRRKYFPKISFINIKPNMKISLSSKRLAAKAKLPNTIPIEAAQTINSTTNSIPLPKKTVTKVTSTNVLMW